MLRLLTASSLSLHIRFLPGLISSTTPSAPDHWAFTMLKEVILVFTLFFSGSQQQCFTDNDSIIFLGPREVNAWVSSRHNFSLALMRLLNSERTQKNVVFSPSTILDSLLLAYFGAAHETEQALAHALQIPDDQNKALTWRFYSNQKLMQIRNHAVYDAFKTANKFFLSDRLTLRPCIEEKFQVEFELIDYTSDIVTAQNYINDWVKNQTNGQIVNAIKKLSYDPLVTVVNAAYFKSKWEDGFNSDLTQYMPFRVNEYETRKINMLAKEGYFAEGRSSQLGARLLRLPLAGNNSAMVILLPDKRLDTMIEAMTDRTIEFLSDQRNYVSVKLKVYIPKFEHRNDINLDKILDMMGIGDSFTPNADYSGFTGNPDIFLNSMTHQAAIKIDEEGTRTVTAGGMLEQGTRHVDAEPFICDHPFAYVIYHYAGRKVIFMGTFRDPEEWSE